MDGKGYELFSKGNYKEALEVFSEAEDGEALYAQAFMYLNGRGIKKDQNLAFALFKRSAESGYVPAFADLGECYGYGKGVKMDDPKAFESFLKGAEAGDVYCMSMVSRMYSEGEGVKKSRKSADEWDSRIPEEYEAEEDQAFTYLESGDVIRARIGLRNCSAMGSPMSSMALSLIFEYGIGVAEDDEEAEDWNDTAEFQDFDSLSREDFRGHENWFDKYTDISEWFD